MWTDAVAASRGPSSEGILGTVQQVLHHADKGHVYWTLLATNVEDLSYSLTPPARLKYFSDKNNNNKLSSTQKINCVQQGDRRVHSSNCTTGLHRKGQTGRTPTEWSRGLGPA